MTKYNYLIGAEENIGMLSDSCNDRDRFIYLSLFEVQVWPMLNKLSYPCDDWKLFCEPASNR